MKKILITDYVHPILPQTFEKNGYSVVYDKDIKLEKTKEIIEDFSGIIINSKTKMYREMIDAAPKLEFICRLGSGMEIVDIPYAKSKGIKVINTPEGNCNAVGEHTMGLLLSVANNLSRCDQEVKKGIWEREKNRGFEIMGKTIGIIGFGHTGKAFASKLQGWGVDLIAYDKYAPEWDEDYVKSVSLNEVIEQADIVSFHLPYNDETHHYFDERFLENCKENLVVLNASRGKVVDTKSLIKGLKSGKLRGAGIDVFENEKVHTYTDSEKKMYAELWAFDNVVLSPHVAGWTHESLRRISEIIIKKLGLQE